MIASPEAPQARLQAFARGPAEGASKGAVEGAAAGAYLVFLLAGPAIVFFPAVLGAGAAAGLAAGTAAGAEAAVPVEQAAAIERLATDAINQLRLPELTAAAVVGSAKKFAELDAAVVDNAVQADSGLHRGLRERGFGVAIAFKVKEIGFEAAGAGTMMSLFLTAEASLVDTMTGKPLARRGLVYLSPRHAHELWTRDGGTLTRAETERAYTTLAERMVEDLLLGASADVNRTNAPFAVCGLAPINPALEWRFGVLSDSKADSVTPMLAWEREPTEAPTAGFPYAHSKERPGVEMPWVRAKPGDITYDLRVWNVADGAPDALVYERLKLPQPQHRVELALEPGSMYFWSVRMRYVVDGRMQATRWSAAASPEPQLFGRLDRAFFYSVVDNGTERRATCIACQCLDFTPAQNYFRFQTP